jgi:hypothetical protein
MVVDGRISRHKKMRMSFVVLGVHVWILRGFDVCPEADSMTLNVQYDGPSVINVPFYTSISNYIATKPSLSTVVINSGLRCVMPFVFCIHA